MTKKANISRNKSSGANISQSKSDGDAFVAFALASVDAFLLFDKGLNLINVNPAAKRLLGLSNKAVGGKNIRDVIPGLLEAEEYEKLLKVKRTGKTLFIDDIRTNTVSGDHTKQLSLSTLITDIS
jgi:PAS domain S-box-containing protein